jgi:hypothetical protein
MRVHLSKLNTSFDQGWDQVDKREQDTFIKN